MAFCSCKRMHFNFSKYKIYLHGEQDDKKCANAFTKFLDCMQKKKQSSRLKIYDYAVRRIDWNDLNNLFVEHKCWQKLPYNCLHFLMGICTRAHTEKYIATHIHWMKNKNQIWMIKETKPRLSNAYDNNRSCWNAVFSLFFFCFKIKHAAEFICS